MTLTVYTARITYTGPDRLDVTRKGGDPLGVAFAPTWEILRPALTARKAVYSPLVRPADKPEAERQAEEAWLAYVEQYTAEMRISAGMTAAHPRFGAAERAAWARGVRPHPEAWREVESRARVILCCFCTDPERCHRRLLASFLVKRGAVDGGELEHVTRCGCGRGLLVEPVGAMCEIHGAVGP